MVKDITTLERNSLIMIDISEINDSYEVRKLTESDAELVLDLCKRNTLFNFYCKIEPTIELILDDMNSRPVGSDITEKYYVGFLSEGQLIAILDYVDRFPEQDSGYLRFFMLDIELQGNNLGTEIIQRFFSYLRSISRSRVVFAVVADNPQAEHFWLKNGCTYVDTVQADNLTADIVERIL